MIAALVLAAGLSRRMGANKLVLPFGQGTVLTQVISVLQKCPLQEIVVVTGHERERIQALIEPIGNNVPPVRCVHNPDYAAGEMLSSIQVGLATMSADCRAALVALGDQPHIEQRIVERIMDAHAPGTVVTPSFNQRGGHPILIDRACWPDILALPAGASLRDVWRAQPDRRRFIDVDTDTILRDLDTPEDYRQMIAHSPQSPPRS